MADKSDDNPPAILPPEEAPPADETGPVEEGAESNGPSSRAASPERPTNNNIRAIEEQQEQLSNEEAAREAGFRQIQDEFNQMVQELGDEPGLSKFRAEYEKLYNALTKTRESEKSLTKMCRDLNDELVASATRVQNAMKMSQNDRAVISSLKKEIKNAWQMVEAAQEKEAAAKDSIDQLKAEVTTLQTSLQQSTLTKLGQEHSVNDMLRQKEELVKERDNQVNQILQLRTEISDLLERVKGIESDKSKAEHEVFTLKEGIAAKKAEAEREARNKNRLERELKESRALIEQKTVENRSKQEAFARAKEEITKLEHVIREQKAMIEKTSKEQEHLQSKTSKLQQDYEEQILNTNQLLAENQSKAAELRLREEDISKIKEEIKMISRVKDNLQKKIKFLEDEKVSAETERDELKAINHSYEREMETLKKQLDNDKRQVDELTRERDIISKNLQKTNNSSQKQSNLLKIHEQTRKTLEQDITLYKEEAAKQRKIIFQLEKERDKYISDATAVQNQLQEKLDELKKKEMIIFDYKKKIAEVETKLKQQQNLYEAVRSDRNLYSKNLVEAQDDINEMKRKLKIMGHQIDQLKEEIESKESALVNERFQCVAIEKERENLKGELQKLKQQSELAQQYIRNQQAEEQKLRAIIQEADTERQRQKKEYEAVVQERDILGAQLIRRNDELSLLYEKIKIQQSTLSKGEVQYRERIEDLRILKLEIKRLRREKAVLQHETSNSETLRKDIIRLQRDILREKSRVKVLEEELQNPVNIHRWRKLEGTDPATYELIQKVQSLQKRLISKTEEVIEKELLIQQKEKLYSDLKTILARQPGPEVIEQLSVYQNILKDKTGQLKSMASELNMYHSQVAEYKYEIEKLNKDLLNVKKKYFEEKKKQYSGGSKTVGKLPSLPEEKALDQSLANAINA